MISKSINLRIFKITRRKIILGLGGSAGLFIIIFAFLYLTNWRYWESTDNAYVQADISIISPKITSYVEEIFVQENQLVKKGELLATLRSVENQANLQEAEANIALTQANLLNVGAKLELQNSVISEQRANFESAKIEYQRAKQEYSRTENLEKAHIFSKKQLETINASYLKAKATVTSAQAVLKAAQQQIPVLLTEKKQGEARLQQAEAQKLIAIEDLGNTKIISPIEGIIGNKTLQLGQLVRPGQQLMVLVPLNCYIYANFKETQIEKMQRGQKVKIFLDSYPSREFKGKVHSFSPASGSVFSLLPPENATGNFTKIVQRLPVKIEFEEFPQDIKIRPGMSATVKVKVVGHE